MALRMNRTPEQINAALMAEGTAIVKVLRRSGTEMAHVVIEGNPGGHRFEMQAVVNHDRAPRGNYLGKAIILREDGEQVDAQMFWAAFGTAYARAIDPVAQPGSTKNPAYQVPVGPIGVGDFVEVKNGQTFRGVVADVLTSRKSGQPVSYLILSADGEEAVPPATCTLVAKSR